MPRLAIGLLLALFLSGCSLLPPQNVPEHDVIDAQLGEPFTLRLHQTAHLTDAPLRVRFSEVTEDSRCPSDVVCVWAGRAILSLRLDESGKEPVDLAVALPSESLRPPGHDRYRITLQSLAPYPTTQQPIDPAAYQARLVVERR